MSSGGNQPSTTTTSTEPPAFIQPFLQDAAKQSQTLYRQGPSQYYPGSTVVPFSGQTEQALGNIENRAQAGSPVNDAAAGYTEDVLNGKYLNNNPYLDATFNRGADAVQNRLSSQFAGSGRDLDASRPAQAQELNDLATGIYGGAYANERQAQQAMVPFAGQVSENQYAADNHLLDVGGRMEDLTGNYMQDAAARWDYQQQAPGQSLDSYIGRLTGGYPGSTQSSVTPTYRNRTTGALGGASAGASVGSAFGPYGTAIGAVAGGLLGAYG